MKTKSIFFTVLILSQVIILASCDKIKHSIKYAKAQAAYNQGNLNKAIELYRELIKDNPGDAKLQWDLGTVYFSKGEKLRVQKQITELRKLNRNDLADDLQQLSER